MNEGWQKLKKKFNDDPVTMILIGSIVVTATAKLLDSVSTAQSRRAYARSVEYRVGR